MRRLLVVLICVITVAGVVLAAPKTNTKIITFGQWLDVKWIVGAVEASQVDLKVRPLMVNGKTLEHTTGEPHDVTNRIFVVRRAYRLNDTLPGEKGPTKWRWEPGGWLMMDRASARISKLNLPEFDPYYSTAIWYRDYAAYCGVSDDGEKLYAMVAQLGRRKPVLKKLLGHPKGGELPGSECDMAEWQRGPVRVTFHPTGGETVSFTIRGHAVETIAEPTDAEEGTSDQ